MFENKTQYGFLVYDPEHREYFHQRDGESDKEVQRWTKDANEAYIFLTEKDARWFLEAEAMINREEGMIFNVLRTTTVMVMEE
nr:MAG TPA: hypothetical protein [Caudoviricetes sp.]